jgi:hypothetical protein
MNKRHYIICGVERGWKGMRQFALAMTEKGYHVDLMLREKLPPDLLKIISHRPGIHIVSCNKKVFPFQFAAKAIGEVLFGKVVWLVFNRQERVKKNKWLCQLVRAECLVLEEDGNDYRLFSKGSAITIEELEDLKKTQ